MKLLSPVILGNMTEARRHHYVPAFYLAQFADPKERLGRLRVYDRTSGKQYGSSPDGAAHERDFYRVASQVPGDETIVETTLADLEDKWAPVVRSVNADGRLPASVADRDLLLALVAFQAVRVPGMRKRLRDFQSDLMMRVLEVAASDRQVLANTARQMNPAMTNEELNELQEEIREFLAAPGAHVEIDRTSLVAQALQTAPEIGRALGQRYWALGMASSDIPLVTTDNPVSFSWASRGSPPPGWAPGFGRADTTVVFPIGPHFVLLGTPYPLADERPQLSRDSTATLNSIIASQADQRVFFRGEGFYHRSKGGAIVEGPTEDLRLPVGSE